MHVADDETRVRSEVLDAYEAIPSLDKHGEMIRLVLAEATMIAERYRSVRRHDIPHIREMIGLLDVLWQEIEMVAARPIEAPAAQPLEQPPGGAFRHWRDAQRAAPPA